MRSVSPDSLRRWALGVSFLFLVAACAENPAEPSEESVTSSTLVVQSTTSTLEEVDDSAVTTTSVDAEWPDWATSTVVEMDPISLAQVGPAIPAGAWTEGSAVTDDLIALVTWSWEGARWRLVVASRETGELLFDQPVGDMNVLGMFTAPSGEVMVVEPIRSADWNFADGFVVYGYDREVGGLREAARFDEGEFNPYSLTVLSDGRLGFVGRERNGDAFDLYRIVVFDWQTNEAVTDVILDDLPLVADAPEGVFVHHMLHPVVWDEPRDRTLVVHAHEEVITTVSMATGEVEEVPLVRDQTLLGALLSWLVPTADAKGLPSVQRQAVISGEHLFVAGSGITFEDREDGTHTYTITPSDLLRIDLDTLSIEESAQPGVAFVTASPNGGYLIGGGQTTTGQVGEELTTTESEEFAGLLVIDPETLEVIAQYAGPKVTSEYAAQTSPTGDLLYVGHHVGNIHTFNPTTGDLESTSESGFERSLIKNSLRYAVIPNPP